MLTKVRLNVGKKVMMDVGGRRRRIQASFQPLEIIF
jgi:hypothetical protein